VWIQPDHLQKAQKAPFLCRVEPNKRDDFVPLYTTPPAVPAPVQEPELPLELGGVQEAIKEGSGVWRSCSGCHELNEGHATGPFSKVFGCALGNGCSECGGIGAVWDDTDYEEMARTWDEADQPAAQRTWVGLTPHERMMCRSYDIDTTIDKTEAKLKEKNHDPM
jgi:hypothetical protein